MKKLIKLTESDLHNIIRESIDKVVNEGLWGNLKAGIQGAYNGYKTNQAVSGMDSARSQMRKRNIGVSKERQAFGNMTNSLNQLSQTAQAYAQQINDTYNNGDVENADMLKDYMSLLKSIMKHIEQYYQQVYPQDNGVDKF